MTTPPIKVLLVEDNPGDADLVREHLSEAKGFHFEVSQVDRLAEAVDRGGAESFDVVILDLGLPDSAGLATFDHLHTACPQLPIVVLTGLEDETIGLAAVRQGAQDYLFKRQVTGPSLLGAIRYAIERKKGEQAVHQARDEAERQARLVMSLNAELGERVRDRTAELKQANEGLQRDAALIATINNALSRFISAERNQAVFETLLHDLIGLTGSQYGLINELSHTPEGEPYLTALAITDIAWDDESRQLYAKYRSGELRWTNMKTLFGAVVTTGEPVIANDAAHDPRRGGTPPGHPTLHAFLGLPLHARQELVGIIGLANAPGGFDPSVIRFLEPVTRACATLIAALKTERQRQEGEKALRQRTHELETSNRELDAFCYTVSHDLRSPLRAIDGYACIVQQEYAQQLPGEAQTLLTQVRAGAQRMDRLIEDLLAFARLARRSINLQTVSMEDLVAEVREMMRTACEGRVIEWQVSPLPACRCDRFLVRQVIFHLLDNAIKFTRSRNPARIEVGVQPGEKPGEIIYFVKDNGVGFDMQYAPKLFGVFQRLHRTEEYEGTGVGLALAQRIVHMHGGRIWVEAALDQGATVSFSLPAADKG